MHIYVRWQKQDAEEEELGESDFDDDEDPESNDDERTSGKDEVRSTEDINAAKCLLDDVFVLRGPKKRRDARGQESAPVLAFAAYLAGEHCDGDDSDRGRSSKRLLTSRLEEAFSVEDRYMVLKLSRDMCGPEPSAVELQSRLDRHGAILVHLPAHSALVHVESVSGGDGLSLRVFACSPMESELSHTGSAGGHLTHCCAAVPFAQRTGPQASFHHLLEDIVSLRDSKYADALPKARKGSVDMPEEREPPCMMYLTEMASWNACVRDKGSPAAGGMPGVQVLSRRGLLPQRRRMASLPGLARA
jgi:hypothetical protein